MSKFFAGSMLATVLFFSGCSSTPKAPVAPAEPAPVPRIHYDEIQNRLNLDLAPGAVGFKERVFDACDLGPALRQLDEPLKDCHKAYFSLVQFQLQCRPTEEASGTLEESDLTPVRDQRLTFLLGKAKGQTRTDGAGFATVRAITSGSSKRAYLRVSTGVDFLVVRANEVTNIVTTPSWCIPQP